MDAPNGPKFIQHRYRRHFAVLTMVYVAVTHIAIEYDYVDTRTCTSKRRWYEMEEAEVCFL